jgi:hypothetical protein
MPRWSRCRRGSRTASRGGDDSLGRLTSASDPDVGPCTMQYEPRALMLKVNARFPKWLPLWPSQATDDGPPTRENLVDDQIGRGSWSVVAWRGRARPIRRISDDSTSATRRWAAAERSLDAGRSARHEAARQVATAPVLPVNSL